MKYLLFSFGYISFRSVALGSMGGGEVFKLKKFGSNTVEPVPGALINFTGLRTIRTRAIKSANKVCWVKPLRTILKMDELY